MTDPKLVEAVARAIHVRRTEESGGPQHPFTSLAGWHRAQLTESAKFLISAINTTGTHWVAPITPTDEMAKAYLNEPEPPSSFQVWRAMRTAYLAKPDEEAVNELSANIGQLTKRLTYKEDWNTPASEFKPKRGQEVT